MPVQLSSRLTTRGSRWLVLAVALCVFGLKLFISLRTFGTEDIRTWMGFAHGVRTHGPVGVYAIDFRALPHHTLYNHPPLVGYYLQLINALSDIGVPLRVTLRAVSSAADVVSALLAFEVVRRRAPLSRATLAGLAVGSSPVLVLVSGYHGNTDPVFVMLLLLGAFLIVDASKGLLGGAALGLAIGIKIVPVVSLPALAVYVAFEHRKLLTRVLTGFVAVVAPTWVPALVEHWDALRHNVLGYAGIGGHVWGLPAVFEELGWTGAADFLTGPGRHIVVIIAAVPPALLVLRRRDRAVEAVALSLLLLVCFSPAYALQYLAWPVVAGCILDLPSATLYNVIAGLVLYRTYDHWNGGLPWSHDAVAKPMTQWQRELLPLVWAASIAMVVRGIRRTLSPRATPEDPG